LVATEPEPLPLAAEPAAVYGANIPQRILSAMQPGRDYSRAELTAATGISDAEWTWAIRQLKDEGKVSQTGERRGARYRRH
jgi:type I restriction enzyme S subunit